METGGAPERAPLFVDGTSLGEQPRDGRDGERRAPLGAIVHQDVRRDPERHRLPDVHWTLYRPVMEQYRERYDHSAYTKTLPENGREAAKLLAEGARWMTRWV